MYFVDRTDKICYGRRDKVTEKEGESEISQMSNLINLEGQSSYLLRRKRFQNKQVW